MAATKTPNSTTLVEKMDNQERYSPPWMVERARTVMGGIDFDPASCSEANQTGQGDHVFWQGTGRPSPAVVGTGFPQPTVWYDLEAMGREARTRDRGRAGPASVSGRARQCSLGHRCAVVSPAVAKALCSSLTRSQIFWTQ